MLKKFVVIAISLLLAACAGSSDHGPIYTYNEILIINNSRELIQDVTISSAATGRSFGCANIAPLGICSNRMASRRYKESPVQIDWVFGNNARQTDELTLAVPAFFPPGLPLRAVLEISPQGEISAYFDQDSPMN
jgi:hypothetical protein